MTDQHKGEGAKLLRGLIATVLAVAGATLLWQNHPARSPGEDDLAAYREADTDVLEDVVPPGESAGAEGMAEGGGGPDRLVERDSERLSREREAYQVYQGLEDRVVGYNRPDVLPYRKASPVRLIVDPDSSLELMEELEDAPGPTRRVEVRLSDQIEGELSGPRSLVDISPERRIEESLMPGEPTVIEWQVTPLTDEPFTLALTLVNIFEVDGRARKKRQTVFREEFDVEVSGADRAWLWINRNSGIWGLLALVLAMIVGWPQIKSWFATGGRDEESGSSDPEPGAGAEDDV